MCRERRIVLGKSTVDVDLRRIDGRRSFITHLFRSFPDRFSEVHNALRSLRKAFEMKA